MADHVDRLRDRYLQTELLVDFYVDAVRSRGNPEVGAQLRACDVMAERAILTALEPLQVATPPVLTYFKPGIGASILRIGTRLWDGSFEPSRRDQDHLAQPIPHHRAGSRMRPSGCRPDRMERGIRAGSSHS